MARQSSPLHRLAVIITLVAHNPSRVSRILDSRYNFFTSPEIREETSIRTLCPNLCSPSTECILQCTVVRFSCMKLTWKKPVATCSQDRLRRPQNLLYVSRSCSTESPGLYRPCAMQVSVLRLRFSLVSMSVFSAMPCSFLHISWPHNCVTTLLQSYHADEGRRQWARMDLILLHGALQRWLKIPDWHYLPCRYEASRATRKPLALSRQTLCHTPSHYWLSVQLVVMYGSFTLRLTAIVQQSVSNSFGN